MLRSKWVPDPGKFLSREEVHRLLETGRKRAEAATVRGNTVAVRDYFVVGLALSTGLRVAEIADLKCGGKTRDSGAVEKRGIAASRGSRL
ncbi:MAG: hypothetical protein ACYSWO_27450 [Planctomycetota bacterium]|jgi:integrase